MTSLTTGISQNCHHLYTFNPTGIYHIIIIICTTYRSLHITELNSTEKWCNKVRYWKMIEHQHLCHKKRPRLMVWSTL